MNHEMGMKVPTMMSGDTDIERIVRVGAASQRAGGCHGRNVGAGRFPTKNPNRYYATPTKWE